MECGSDPLLDSPWTPHFFPAWSTLERLYQTRTWLMGLSIHHRSHGSIACLKQTGGTADGYNLRHVAGLKREIDLCLLRNFKRKVFSFLRSESVGASGNVIFPGGRSTRLYRPESFDCVDRSR
jgi:hypothetical protein